MGDSTGSMFYAFSAFIIIYAVGVSVYQGYLLINRWRKNRSDHKYRNME